MASCPYCNQSPFQSMAGTASQKHPEIEEEFETEWLNKCAKCDRWSLYKEVDGLQHELQDPTNPNSEEA